VKRQLGVLNGVKRSAKEIAKRVGEVLWNEHTSETTVTSGGRMNTSETTSETMRECNECVCVT